MAISDDVNQTANDAKEQIAQLRSQVEQLMSERVTPALANAAGKVEDYARQTRDMASDQTEQFSEKVRERPLVAVLIATGVGYLLGRIAR
jgi:ElaB/YqjD/DUF883 family membrane-anchored ribosome-binding protein